VAQSHRNRARSQRVKVWADGPLTTVQTLNATGSTPWGTSQAFNTGATIIRLHGIYNVFLTSVDAAGTGFAGALGIGIATADAIAIGVTALPSPLDDADWTWMVHEHFDVRGSTGTIADGVNASVSSQRIEFDSKAMRKVKPNENIFGMVEVTEVGAATALAHGNSRMLVLLG